MPEPRVRSEVDTEIVKKCWEDEQFKSRLLSDPTGTYKQALARAGSTLPANCAVHVLEESASQLYLVVPVAQKDAARELPGLNERSTRLDFEARLVHQAWQDKGFKQSLLADPKAAYEKLLRTMKPGATLPQTVSVKAVEESSSALYLRIPQRPASLAGAELSEAELEQVAGGLVAVGVAIASYVCVGAVLGAALAVMEQDV